jgi:uncharacterized protein (TIGR00730 family)
VSQIPTSSTPAEPASEGDFAKASIDALIRSVGGEPESTAARYVAELIRTSLKLIPDGADSGQMKLLAASLKEMRHAYRVFARYRGRRKLAIFGSARTPPEHPDYHAARHFSGLMAQQGWMAITGAGDGIMKAGHEGPTREASFGLSIRLPFETSANAVIEGDPKLINFRYFFTRKLMFLSHADAIAVFPGGFGTMDELFEALTLIQTGKSNPAPVVLVEGAGGSYWRTWDDSIRTILLGNGWISPEDPGLYFIAPSVESAVEHVQRFYRRYHSSRFVGDMFVVRMGVPLSDAGIARLNEEFSALLKGGGIVATPPLPGEDDHLELPRLAFAYTRRQYGVLRRFIDRLNELS